MRELSINDVGAVAGGRFFNRATNAANCTSAAMNGFGIGVAVGGAIGSAAGGWGAALGGLFGGLFSGASAISNNHDCGTSGGFGARSDGRGSTGTSGSSNGDGHGF